MQLEQNTFQKRLIAYKVNILHILNSNFLKDDVSAGYIKLNTINVSRVNVIATVVYKTEGKSYANAVIDDGTGRISLRSFENLNIFSKADVGDAVLVIGKVREFNNEKYIIPEIIKKIKNVGWVNIRKLELNKDTTVDEVRTKDDAKEATTNISEEICSLIKKLDNGGGISIDSIIKNFEKVDIEDVIERLLEHGDIFEIRPGMLKVLE